jgi:light-regulated signal transduction histidine kinase (bacteriophytochrome)
VTKNSKIKELPEKASELSEIAKNNCDRLTIIINDILDFEKLQSGAMEFTFSEINLNILVSEALEQCEPYAEEFKVKFKQINSVPDIVLQGDAQRLNQVMLDLLSNAAKFSGEGKKLRSRFHSIKRAPAFPSRIMASALMMTFAARYSKNSARRKILTFALPPGRAWACRYPGQLSKNIKER